MRITLDWPSPKLSPNARGHWSIKSAAAGVAKRAAWAITRAEMAKMAIRTGGMAGQIGVDIAFHPPSKARHDLDNLQARMKSALDGIALALGVDDVHFRPVSRIEAGKSFGAVVVTLTPALVEIPLRGVVT